MLAVLIVALPILIPLLFSPAFLPVVDMSQAAVFSMYIKAISLPISYITLARGDSVGYMVLEAVYDIVLVVLIVIGYRHWGLMGTGVALSVSYVFDILLVGSYTYVRYHYRVSTPVLYYAAIQLSLGLAVYGVVQTANPLVYWLLGPLLCLASLLVSVSILHRKTSLWTSLVKKFKNRFSHHV